MNIEIKAIYISPEHDFFGRHGKDRLKNGVSSVNEVECVAEKGLVGDRFFEHKENYKGQVTFFDLAVFERIKKQFGRPDLEASAFRRNVITAGIDLNKLIGKKFTIQNIVFEGTEESKPCYWMNGAVAEGAEEALKGWGGLRARILSSGTLSVRESKTD